MLVALYAVDANPIAVFVVNFIAIMYDSAVVENRNSQADSI